MMPYVSFITMKPEAEVDATLPPVTTVAKPRNM